MKTYRDILTKDEVRQKVITKMKKLLTRYNRYKDNNFIIKKGNITKYLWKDFYIAEIERCNKILYELTK